MSDPAPPRSPEPGGAPKEKTPEEKLEEILAEAPLTPEQIEADPTKAAKEFLLREWRANVLERETLRPHLRELSEELADEIRVSILGGDPENILKALSLYQVAKREEIQDLYDLKEEERKTGLSPRKIRKKEELERELAPYLAETEALQAKLLATEIDVRNVLDTDEREAFKQEWLADERKEMARTEAAFGEKTRGKGKREHERMAARYGTALHTAVGDDPVKLEAERKILEAEVEKARASQKGTGRILLEGAMEFGRGLVPERLRNRKEKQEAAPRVPEHLAPFERAKEAGLLLSPELIERNPKEAIRTYLMREYECVAQLVRERIEKGEDAAELEVYARTVKDGFLHPSPDILPLLVQRPFLVQEGIKKETELKAKLAEFPDEKEFQRLRALSPRTPAEEAELARRDTLRRATPEFRNTESFLRELEKFDEQAFQLIEKGGAVDFATMITPEEIGAFLKSAVEAERNFVVKLENKAEKKPGSGLDTALAKATERYGEIRAEFIANDITKFVGEETELLKKRAEIAGSFETVRRGWKKLEEINLNKVWKPDSWAGQWVGRLVSARTGISGALALGGLAVPGWGLGFMALRSVMGGLGAGFGAYELLRTRYEAKNMHLTDEEVKKLSDTEVERRLLHLAAYAKMNGSWQAIQQTYDRLGTRYQRDLEEKLAAGVLDDRLMAVEHITKTRKEQAELGKEEWSKEKKRRGAAAGVGVLGALGIHGLRAWWESGAGALTRRLFPDLYADAPAVSEPDYWRTARARGRPLVSVGEDHGTGRPVDEVGTGSPRGRAEDAMKGRGAETPGSGRTAEDAARQAVEDKELRRPGYDMTFKYGEGPIHQARKAIALFSAGNEAAWGRLTPEQKIWAETQLWLRTAKELGLELRPDMQPKQGFFKIGETLKFNSGTINDVLKEAEQRFGSGEGAEAIKRNLGQYVGNVNWNRYRVVNGQGVWELPTDQGIRIRASVPRRDLIDAVAGNTDLKDVRWSLKVETILGSDPGGGEVFIVGETVEMPIESTPALNMSLVPDTVPVPDSAIPAGAPGGLVIRVEQPAATSETAQVLARSVVEGASGLPKKFYELAKDMEVSQILKKRLIPLTETQRWPWPEDVPPNHRDSMRYIKLRDKIKTALGLLNESQRAEAYSMKVDEFIRRNFGAFLPQ